ncbi:DUF2292 domain-containing protein [Vagococcus humatus]|uniref:DUF2292 domain-containing protein n=1 Tax=Vagococcus humatus TaxID=1889241 RepID=A0A3R9YBU9_9ENTE|nr:DUF2292 domain-containing protein [Vagococcus humatus]RST88731.1 hypothetical protein C7P63_09015 [Vagococcus humatus]
MDKVYIENDEKKTTIMLPNYGNVTLIVQDGKVIRLETSITQKLK